MLGNKAQAQARPTAMGTLLQSSTYGQTIPTIYGMTQSPLLAIWAGALRPGGSTKKFKQLKKGPPTFVECIDFLIGKNPIFGVGQIWNNGGKIPLGFAHEDHGVPGNIGGPTYVTITDVRFYAVIGVTLSQDYDVTFNDYGAPSSAHLTGTFEIPLWNEFDCGPDPVYSSSYRYFPNSYRWLPSQGPVVDFSTLYGQSPAGPAVLRIYYSKLLEATSYEPPLTRMRLAFEPQLGNGPEYSVAGLSGQQIIYPMYAGVGSTSIDLGTSGTIPSMQVEVRGKYGLYATGDADFADMIEDVFKSGAAQAAVDDADSSYTQVEHGLSCYDFPGLIQQRSMTSPEVYTKRPMAYNMNVTEGNFLIAIGCSGTFTACADTIGNTWTPVLSSGLDRQVYYCKNIATGPNTVDISSFDYGWSFTILEVAGCDDFDSITIGSGRDVVQTTTNTAGYPAYILTLALYGVGGGLSVPDWEPPHWKLKNGYSMFGRRPGVDHFIWERRVNAPGDYPFHYAVPPVGFFPPPDNLISIAFKCTNAPSYAMPLGDYLDMDSLDLVRMQCRAAGLWGSLAMTNQQPASDWLKLLYAAANAAPCYMGSKLYSIPYSEVSAVGNGAVYHAPTGTGPLRTLSTENGDFVSDKTPVTVTTTPRIGLPNVLQMQCKNRTSDYNPSVVSQPQAAGISFYGIRKADPIVNDAIADVAVARMLLGITGRRLVGAADVYSFTLTAKDCLLPLMGLVTLTDPLANLWQFPARIIEITEDSDTGLLDCKAEPFVFGMCAPTPFTTDAPNGYIPDPASPGGDVNPPIIFQPPALLYANANTPQLWFVVSCDNQNYGGCQVLVSTDGGVSYVPLGDPIRGNAVTGVTTADWPAPVPPLPIAPDTTNDLPVNLSESLGALLSYGVTDEDNNVYPCYVFGGQPAVAATGAQGFSHGAPLQVTNAGSIWHQFQFPALPHDAVITGIYPYIYALEGTGPQLSSATSGPYAGMSLFGGGTANFNLSGMTTTPTVAYNPSIGTDPTVLSTVGIQCNGGRSVPDGGPSSSFVQYSVAYAIVYTSATPVIDSLSPPPFSIPGGSGLAFALPMATISGTDFPSGGNGNAYSSVGTPASGYELMSYAVADMTAANQYTLMATGSGNHLNRAIFGSPPVGGVDHPSGSRFAFLDPSGIGQLHVDIPANWFGQTLYFKFPSYNVFGASVQSSAGLTAYPYTLQASAGAGGYQLFLVNGE